VESNLKQTHQAHGLAQSESRFEPYSKYLVSY